MGDQVTAEGLMALLKTPGLRVTAEKQVTSTNDVLRARGAEGAPEGEVLVAESQTKGRGRLGRRFFSPEGSGLYVSVLLRPALPAGEALFITTAAAVAAAEAIDRALGAPGAAKIKWVNDVYLKERKVCGILTESVLDTKTGGLKYAVLGMGINLFPPAGGFPEAVRDVAGAVFEAAPPAGTAARLLAGLLDGFFAIYRALPDRGYMARYRVRSLLTGRQVTFLEAGQRQGGEVLGVDENAALLVRLHDGTVRALSSGEVQLEKGFARPEQHESGPKG